MNKETLLRRKKKKKLFPWLKTFYSKCAEKFLNKNEAQAVEYLSLNVDNEIRALIVEPNEKKATELFHILDTILLHLNWKIHRKSFKQWKSYWKKEESSTNDTSDVQKRSCTKLLYYLLYLSLLLANGNKESEWINRILTIFKIMPSLLDASYSALLLVDNLKKKYSPVYYLILKYVLLNFTIKKEVNCLLYSKVILLFRRLLKFTKRETEKQQILSAALKQHPPADFISWLSSIDDNSIKNLRIENVMNELLSRTYPDDLLRKLQEVLRQEENYYQNTGNLNTADHYTDGELSCSNSQESRFSENLSLTETEKTQVTNEINVKRILGSEETVSSKTIKKKKKIKVDSNNADHLTDEELSCPNHQEHKLTFSEIPSSNATPLVKNEFQGEGILSSAKTDSPKKIKKKKKRKDTESKKHKKSKKSKKKKRHKTDEDLEKTHLKKHSNDNIVEEHKVTFNNNLELHVSQDNCQLLNNKLEHLDNNFEVKVQKENELFTSKSERKEKNKHKMKKKKKESKSEDKKISKVNKRKHSIETENEVNNQNVTNDTIISNSDLEMCFSQNEERVIPNYTTNNSIEDSSEETLETSFKNENVEAEIDCSDTINVHKKRKKLKSTKKHKEEAKKKKDKSQIPYTEILETNSHHLENNDPTDAQKLNLSIDLEISSKSKRKVIPNDTQEISSDKEKSILFSEDENLETESDCSDTINVPKKSKKLKKTKKHKKESKNTKKKKEKSRTLDEEMLETDSHLEDNNLSDPQKLNSSSDLEMSSESSRNVIPNHTQEISLAKEKSEEVFKIVSEDENLETEINCSDAINKHKKSKKLQKSKKHKNESKKIKEKSRTPERQALETDSHNLDNNNISDAEKLNSDSDSEKCFSQINRNIIPNDTPEISVAEKTSEEMFKTSSKDNKVERKIDCSNTINLHKKSKKLKKSKRHKKESKNTEKKKDKSRTPETQVLETDSISLDNDSLSDTEKLNSDSDSKMCYSQINKNTTPNDTQNDAETEIDCSNTINVHKKSIKLKKIKRHKKESKISKSKKEKFQTSDTQMLETDSCHQDNNRSDTKKVNSNSGLEMCFSQIEGNNIQNYTQGNSLTEKNFNEMLEKSHEDDNIETEIGGCDVIRVHKESRKHKKEIKNSKKKKDNSQTCEEQLSGAGLRHLNNNSLSNPEELICSKIEKDEKRMMEMTAQKNKFKTNDAVNYNASPKKGMKNKNSKSKMKKLFNAESNTLKAKDCILSNTLEDDAHKKDGPVASIKQNPVKETEVSNSSEETLLPNSELIETANPTKFKDSQSIESLNASDSDDATTCSNISISELLKFPKINISRNNKALGIQEQVKNKNKKSSLSNLNSMQSVKNSSPKCHKRRKIDPDSSEETNNELIVASKNILAQTQTSESYGSQSLFEEEINSLDSDDKSNEAPLCSDMTNNPTQNCEQVFNNNNSCNIDVTTNLISNSLTFESHQSSHVSSSLHLKIGNSKISAKSSTSSVFSLSSSNNMSPSSSSNVEMNNIQNHHSENEINLSSKPRLFLPYVVLEDIEKSFSKSSSSTFDLQSSNSSKVINDCESSYSAANSVASLCQSQLTSCTELNEDENSPSPLSRSPSLLSPCRQVDLDKIPSSLPPLIENESTKPIPCFIQNEVKSDNQYESESNSLTSFDNNQGNNLFTAENSILADPNTFSRVDSKEYLSSIVPPIEFFNDEEHSLSSTNEYQSDQTSLFIESETDSKNFICNNINDDQSDVNRRECANIRTNVNSVDCGNSLVECRINNANNSNYNPSLANVSSIQIIINLNKNDHQLVNTNQLITNINFHSSSNSYESPVVSSAFLNPENAPVMTNDVPVSQHFVLNQASQTVELADSNIDFLRPCISLNEGSQICTNSDINLPKSEVLQSSPISTKGSQPDPNFSTPLISNILNSENLNRLNLNNSFPSSIYEDLKIINTQTNFYENADSQVHNSMNHPTENTETSSTEQIASLQLNESFSKIRDHDSRTGTDVYSSLSSDDLSVSTLSLISDIETELSVGENILISLEAKDYKRKCQTQKNIPKKCTLSVNKSSKASYPKKAPPRKRKKTGVSVSKSKKIKTGLCSNQNINLLSTIKALSDVGKDTIATNITPTNNSRYNFRNRSSLQKPRKFYYDGNESIL